MNWGIFMGWLSAVPNYSEKDLRIMAIMFFGSVWYVKSACNRSFPLTEGPQLDN